VAGSWQTSTGSYSNTIRDRIGLCPTGASEAKQKAAAARQQWRETMERTPNAALSQYLREAGWSDKGTARRVNIERHHRGRGSGYGGANVRGWRTGVLPDPLTRQVLAFLLSAELGRRISEAELGFPAGHSEPLGLRWAGRIDHAVEDLTLLWQADADRAERLATIGFAAGGFAAPARDWLIAWPDPDASRAGGRTVGAIDVEVLWRAAESYQEMDRRLGGGSAREGVLHLLTSVVTPLLRGSYGDHVGRELLAVAARLTDILGYAGFDGTHQGLAQRYFIQALRLARAAGRDDLAAHIFGDMTRQSIHIGDLDEAAALARAGQRAAESGQSPVDRARCACLEARVLAMRYDSAGCAQAMLRAEAAMGRVTPDNTPAWAAYFSPDQLEAEFAHAAAADRRPRDVLRFSAAALKAGRPLERRNALLTVAVAQAHVSIGDTEAAAAIATQLRERAAGIASQRVAEALRGLTEGLSPVSALAPF
jgi:hypothetical protein